MASFGRRSGSESSFLIIMIIGPLSEWHIRVSEDFWPYAIFCCFTKTVNLSHSQLSSQRAPGNSEEGGDRRGSDSGHIPALKPHVSKHVSAGLRRRHLPGGLFRHPIARAANLRAGVRPKLMPFIGDPLRTGT